VERFLAPEILFNPELVGQEYPGVHQVIVDSINRTDLDLRKSLFSNIVLSGGSTLCTGQSGGPEVQRCSGAAVQRSSSAHISITS
jgi:hypothetical protein